MSLQAVVAALKLWQVALALPQQPEGSFIWAKVIRRGAIAPFDCQATLLRNIMVTVCCTTPTVGKMYKMNTLYAMHNMY